MGLVQAHPMSGVTFDQFAHQVIARLAERLARGEDDSTTAELDSVEIDRFCDALVCSDEQRAMRIIENRRSLGATLNTLYLGYLAGSARRLGARWEDDTASFLDLTIASGRIYHIMRGLRRSMIQPITNKPRKAFFTAVPGETHTLGVTMAADLFRHRGWDIEVEIGKTHDELVELIDGSNHAIVGLSASRPAMIVSLASLIVDVRIRRPEIFIMVSGKIIDLTPNIESLVDADFIARDANSAIVAVEQIHANG